MSAWNACNRSDVINLVMNTPFPEQIKSYESNSISCQLKPMEPRSRGQLIRVILKKVLNSFTWDKVIGLKEPVSHTMHSKKKTTTLCGRWILFKADDSTSKPTAFGWDDQNTWTWLETDGRKLTGIKKLLTDLAWLCLDSMNEYIRKHLMPHG